ncbi:MAG: hypothetical protein IJY92_04360 [Alphaproteobacteria bacterium]|nr:hypothetical protein [Alphaproteobacteria bacterium]
MKKRADIPFSSDSSKFFIPWLSMFMVFIATLILSVAIVVYSSVQSWTDNISGSLTVQIPTYTEKGESREEKIATDIEMALTLLRSSDGITGASLLTDEQVSALMEPWIGQSDSMMELPLPKIIDVNVDSKNFPNITQLKADLYEQVPEAVLDSHRAALDELVLFFENMVNLIAFILILILITTAISVIYVTKSSLSVHEKVIELIHMMGASDFYITIQFAMRSFKLTLIGSLVGFILALPIMALFNYFLSQMNGSFVLESQLGILQWVLLASVPFLTAILSFLTAYKTVSKALKQIL